MGADESETPGVSERCVTCGARIEGDDHDDLIRRYTDHQAEVHDKPRTVHEQGA